MVSERPTALNRGETYFRSSNVTRAINKIISSTCKINEWIQIGNRRVWFFSDRHWLHRPKHMYDVSIKSDSISMTSVSHTAIRFIVTPLCIESALTTQCTNAEKQMSFGITPRWHGNFFIRTDTQIIHLRESPSQCHTSNWRQLCFLWNESPTVDVASQWTVSMTDIERPSFDDWESDHDHAQLRRKFRLHSDGQRCGTPYAMCAHMCDFYSIRHKMNARFAVGKDWRTFRLQLTIVYLRAQNDC